MKGVWILEKEYDYEGSTVQAVFRASTPIKKMQVWPWQDELKSWRKTGFDHYEAEHENGVYTLHLWFASFDAV